MKLVDLDQQIFVPVVDETNGGAVYEMGMTVGEFFDKCCEGFKPEVVDAVPVDWLKAKMRECENREYNEPWQCYKFVLWAWGKEQGQEYDRKA